LNSLPYLQNRNRFYFLKYPVRKWLNSGKIFVNNVNFPSADLLSEPPAVAGGLTLHFHLPIFNHPLPQMVLT
jgi:hypothetical protein